MILSSEAHDWKVPLKLIPAELTLLGNVISVNLKHEENVVPILFKFDAPELKITLLKEEQPENVLANVFGLNPDGNTMLFKLTHAWKVFEKL